MPRARIRINGRSVGVGPARIAGKKADVRLEGAWPVELQVGDEKFHLILKLDRAGQITAMGREGVGLFGSIAGHTGSVTRLKAKPDGRASLGSLLSGVFVADPSKDGVWVTAALHDGVILRTDEWSKVPPIDVYDFWEGPRGEAQVALKTKPKRLRSAKPHLFVVFRDFQYEPIGSAKSFSGMKTIPSEGIISGLTVGANGYVLAGRWSYQLPSIYEGHSLEIYRFPRENLILFVVYRKNGETVMDALIYRLEGREFEGDAAQTRDLETALQKKYRYALELVPIWGTELLAERNYELGRRAFHNGNNDLAKRYFQRIPPTARRYHANASRFLALWIPSRERILRKGTREEKKQLKWDIAEGRRRFEGRSKSRAEVRNRDSAARQLVRNQLRKVLFHQAADLSQMLSNEAKEAVLTLIPGPLLVENGVDEDSILWFRQKEDDEGLSESNPVIRLWSGEGSLEIAFGSKEHPTQYAHLLFKELADGDLFLNSFSMMSFRDAEKYSELKSYGSPVFIWWLEKNFLPFAEQLGFKSLGFDAGDLSSNRSSGTIAKLEVEKLRAGRSGDRGWTVDLAKLRTFRSEARAPGKDDEDLAHPPTKAFVSDEDRAAHYSAEDEALIEQYLVNNPVEFIKDGRIGKKIGFESVDAVAFVRRLIGNIQRRVKMTGWPLRDREGNRLRFVAVEDKAGQNTYVAALPLDMFNDYEWIDKIAQTMDRSGKSKWSAADVSFLQDLGKDQNRGKALALLQFMLFDESHRRMDQYKPPTIQFLRELQEHVRTRRSFSHLLPKKQLEELTVQKDFAMQPISLSRSRQGIEAALHVLKARILRDLRDQPELKDVWVDPERYHKLFVRGGYQSDTTRAFETLFRVGLLIRKKQPRAGMQHEVWHYRLAEKGLQETSTPGRRSEVLSEVRADDVRAAPGEVRVYTPAPSQSLF